MVHKFYVGVLIMKSGLIPEAICFKHSMNRTLVEKRVQKMKDRWDTEGRVLWHGIFELEAEFEAELDPPPEE